MISLVYQGEVAVTCRARRRNIAMLAAAVDKLRNERGIVRKLPALKRIAEILGQASTRAEVDRAMCAGDTPLGWGFVRSVMDEVSALNTTKGKLTAIYATFRSLMFTVLG